MMRIRRFPFVRIVVNVLLILVNAAGYSLATKTPYGLPVNGLQASIQSDRTIYYEKDSIELTLTLTNVSDHPIQIDAWPGNWSLEIVDEKWHLVPSINAVDVIRPAPQFLTLQPQQQWETNIEGLRFTPHLPGSTPLWSYEPLSSGVYGLRGRYATQYSSDHPDLWLGTLTTTSIKIEVISK